MNVHLSMPLAANLIFTETLYKIVAIFSIGIIGALIYTIYNKSVFGRFITALKSMNAVGEENAKTLEQLGFENNKIIKNSLRRNVTLSRKIKSTENRYYIIQEDLSELQKRYGTKGISTRDILLTLVLLIAIFLVAWFVIPSLTMLLNKLLHK